MREKLLKVKGKEKKRKGADTMEQFKQKEGGVT
jgi:hypothetical protein